MKTAVRAAMVALLVSGMIGVVPTPISGDGPAGAAPAAHAELLDPAGGVYDVEFSTDGATAYVSSGSAVVVYDTSDWSVTTTVDVGGGARMLDLVADGSALLVAVSATGEVVEIDTATNTVSTRVDLLTLLGDGRTWDVQEIDTDDVLVTSNPGSNGLAFVVRYDRNDPAGTARRVAGERIIRAGPRVFADFGGALVAVGEGFFPNSLYILDVTDPDAPIVIEDSHGSVGGTQGSALDLPRDRVITAGGQSMSTLTGDVTTLGFSGRPVIDSARNTLWIYTNDAVVARNLITLAVVDSFEPTCPLLTSVSNPSVSSVSLTPDGDNLMIVFSGGFAEPEACLEPLDGLDPPPSTPVDVTAFAGDASAVVVWESPEGGPVVPAADFIVTSSPGGITCETTEMWCDVSGLTNGVEYTFTVAGRDGAAVGAPSVASNPVTPLAPPKAPSQLHVGSDGVLSWAPGAGVVDDVTVRYREVSGGGDWLKPLIFGGDDIAITEQSHNVKLFGFAGSNVVQECGGVLIAPRWVVTAAHCLEYQPTGTYYADIDYFSVVAGVADWTDALDDIERFRFFSESLIPHPWYDSVNLIHDLALVELENSVPSSVAQPIPMYPVESLPDGASAFISGWGLDEFDVFPDVLQGTTVTIDADCGDWQGLLEGTTLCTSVASGAVCSGDSGGPVAVNEGGALFLAGVVSFGSAVGCGESPNLPDAHVRLAAYTNWIESYTGQLWHEISLPGSASRVAIDSLKTGKTYALSVESSNNLWSRHALTTATITGMNVRTVNEIGVDCSVPIPHPFLDVPVSSFALDSIGCIAALKVTTGTTPTTYSPTHLVTRDQMAAFMARFLDAITGEKCTGSHSFIDVTPDSFAYGSVGCIFELGITNGTSPSTYGPGEFVTREQMAAFIARLYRMVTAEKCSIPSPLPDVPSTSFAYRDVGCIYDLGVTTGTSTSTYSPSQPVTREQMAAFIERLYKVIVS